MSGSTTTGSTGASTGESVQELCDWLVARVAEYLEVKASEIDVDASFESQGLDSMSMLALWDEITNRFAITIEPSAAWDFPNITELAEHLATTLAEQATAR